MPVHDKSYKRRYLRIKPQDDIFALVSIAQVGEQPVSTRSAKVRIHNISPGGLMFSSGLCFPLYTDLTLGLSLYFADHRIQLEGMIVHKEELMKGMYEYGICFTNSRTLPRTCLLKLFNNNIVKIHDHLIILKFN